MIHLVRKMQSELHDAPIGYAGRLDPMAHGVLVLMVGAATKHRDEYLHLQKSYTFEIVYGMTTDTFDILGLLKDKSYIAPPKNAKSFVNSFVNIRVGTWEQEYPPFSSKTVNGKPLFWWAKNGLLHTISIPKHTVTVDSFAVEAHTTIDTYILQNMIKQRIQSVSGEFRQEETLKLWEDFFQINQNTQFMSSKFSITCSSGTYMRGIAQELGQSLGCGAVTIDILRTKVGDYDLADALRIIP